VGEGERRRVVVGRRLAVRLGGEAARVSWEEDEGRGRRNRRVGSPYGTRRRRGWKGVFGCLPRIGALVGGLLE
jgi:hypothetical protein